MGRVGGSVNVPKKEKEGLVVGLVVCVRLKREKEGIRVRMQMQVG